MTGSDSTASCKGTGRPSLQHQREQTSSKSSELEPTDQLRRLAIKNSHGSSSKSLPISSLATRRAAACSSSTSSLNQISSIAVHQPPKPAETQSAAALVDCKLPPLPQAASTTTAAEKQSSSSKCTPYITRQELLHSLRRTASNFSVGVTQTTCSGSSSYVHYTPRHLTRTNFNPKPGLLRTSSATPDPDLGKSELFLLPGDEECDVDACDETRSMVELHQVRRPSPGPSGLRASRNLRGASPGVPQFRSVEVPMDSRHQHAYRRTGLEGRTQDTRVTQTCSPHANCPELRRTASTSKPAMPRGHRQRSPPRLLNGCGGPGVIGGGHNLEVSYMQASYAHQLPVISSTSLATGTCASASRHVPMAAVVAQDSRLKLHIPQGKKMASLV